MKHVMQTVLHNESKQGNCLRAVLSSLFEVSIESIPEFELMKKDEWKKSLTLWVKAQGYQLFDYNGDIGLNTYYVGVGEAARGVRHCAIYRCGTLEHDPHPDNSGLSSFERSWLFISSTPDVESMIIQNALHYLSLMKRWVIANKTQGEIEKSFAACIAICNQAVEEPDILSKKTIDVLSLISEEAHKNHHNFTLLAAAY